MSVIKRSVQRNGKTYLQVKQLKLPEGADYSEHREAQQIHKEIGCFMCINNSKAGSLCKEYHKNDPACSETPDHVFISEHSLKRYLKMAVIQRMEES